MKLTLKFVTATGWCPACKALHRAGTVDKFAEKHPEIRVEQHDDSSDGSGNTSWENLADKWHVKGVPTVIWIAGGEELFRSSDISARGLAAQLEKALKAVER